MYVLNCQAHVMCRQCHYEFGKLREVVLVSMDTSECDKTPRDVSKR